MKLRGGLLRLGSIGGPSTTPFTAKRIMRILLVEDSRQLSNWLAKTLRRDNYAVDCVYDGDDADYALKSQDYAMVILDLSLPKLDGIEVLKRLRARGNNVPVLILTANNSVAGRVTG